MYSQSSTQSTQSSQSTQSTQSTQDDPWGMEDLDDTALMEAIRN